MLLAAFTMFHVALSLAGIATGFVVLYGLITAREFQGWTNTFLITTAATSLTGFLFPIHHFTPGIALGILSLLVLGIAIPARSKFHFAGNWRWIYAVTATLALYFNVFVLVVQSFEKVPALRATAPAQSGPAFQLTQLAVLVIFVALGSLAAARFHAQPLRTA
ncbi:MAG TPA: hypothetical protein VMB25_11660 [Bryobacteraceae bacterium]|nr:hypothetical protein [Bryobacteraceae bacterium]